MVPSPDNPMDIVCNNGIIKADYTRLEYLESTGTQYIVTNITGGATIKAEAQGTSSAAISECVFSFTEPGWAGSWLGQNNNPYGKWSLGDLNSTTTVSYTTKATIDATFDLLDGKPHALATINTQTVERTKASSVNLESLSLFATSNGSFPAKVRIWYTEIIQNNVLVCSLLPAKRNSDNVLGMYDIVSGTFLTNAGTGNFIAGPELGNIIYCDGLTETLRISTKNLYDVNAVTENYYIDANGTIVSNNVSCYSGLINVAPQQTYTFSGICGSSVSISNNKRIHGYIDGVWEQQILVEAININTPYSLTFTIPANINGIRISCLKDDTKRMVELGSSATTYVDYNNSTATAAMLLKLGDYIDSQDILSGIVARQVGILVLKGTEDWVGYMLKSDASDSYIVYSSDYKVQTRDTSIGLCNKFKKSNNTVWQLVGYPNTFVVNASRQLHLNIDNTLLGITDYTQETKASLTAKTKAFIRNLYNIGDPIIVIMPLSHTTFESVAPQALDTVAGTNTFEITQASLAGLELKAEYKRH